MAARYSTQNLNTTLTNFGLEVSRSGGPSIVPEIAPIVRVGLTDTKFYKFNNSREMVTNDFDAERAPKDTSNEINRSYTSATLSLKQRGLRELIADEEVDNADMSVINPEQDAAGLIVSKLKLVQEAELNSLLFDASTTFTDYTAAATAYWDAGTTYIEADIDAAKTSVMTNAGVMPNTIVIPDSIAKIAKRTTELRNLVKYTDPTLLVNGDLPPTLFGLKVVIPTSLNNEANPGVSTASMDFLHDDKNVWVGYVEREAPSKRSLSCFYTFLRPLAGVADIAMFKYRDDGRHGNWVEGLWEYDIECVAANAGYVISGCDA